MHTVLLVIATVFAVLAAVLHVVIFRLESIAWSTPAVWKRFGVASQADADVVRPMAYNQGFYNLFLGVGALLGAILLWTPVAQAGFGVALFATGSMLAAASVLILSNPKLARAAITQGTFPLLAVLFLLLSLVTA
jgi:putative membrane protein